MTTDVSADRQSQVTSGVRFLTMSWPSLEASVRIRLLTEEAPTISNAVWDALPFDTVQGHALITGQMMFATSPVLLLVRENVHIFTEMGIGACFYATASQNIGLIYGDVTEPEGHSIWGQIDEQDWPTLRSVGRRVWQNLLARFGDPRLDPLAKRTIVVHVERAESITT